MLLRNPPQKRFNSFYGNHYTWDTDEPGTLTTFFIKNQISKRVGHDYVCLHCRYSLLCSIKRYPRICCHCRTVLLYYFVPYLPISLRDRLHVEKEYCYYQPEKLRVSSTCPLFRESLIVCVLCREKEDNLGLYQGYSINEQK